MPADIALPAPIFESATSTIPVTVSKSSPETTIVPFKPDSAPNLPANLTLELRVYSRRKVVRDIETPMPSAHSQLTEPNPDPHDHNSGNTVTDTNPGVLNDLDVPIAFQKGVRSCSTHPIADFVFYERLSPQFRALTTNLSKVDIPRDIYKVLQHPNWKAAMHEEIKALEKNGTWELTELPLGKSTIKCKWIFNVKYKADGNIDKYKARLVAKGFTQTYGVDS